MRVEVFLRDNDDAAILAHLDEIEALRRALVHPVLAFELGEDAVDRAFDAERLSAADAVKRLLLPEHPRRRGGGERQTQAQREHLPRTGRLARPAWRAAIL